MFWFDIPAQEGAYCDPHFTNEEDTWDDYIICLMSYNLEAEDQD